MRVSSSSHPTRGKNKVIFIQLCWWRLCSICMPMDFLLLLVFGTCNLTLFYWSSCCMISHPLLVVTWHMLHLVDLMVHYCSMLKIMICCLIVGIMHIWFDDYQWHDMLVLVGGFVYQIDYFMDPWFNAKIVWGLYYDEMCWFDSYYCKWCTYFDMLLLFPYRCVGRCIMDDARWWLYIFVVSSWAMFMLLLHTRVLCCSVDVMIICHYCSHMSWWSVTATITLFAARWWLYLMHLDGCMHDEIILLIIHHLVGWPKCL